MALVQQYWEMIVELIDSGAQQTRLTYQLTAATHIQALIDAPVVLAYLEAVCALGTVGYSLREVYANDALVIPSDSRVQKEVKALLVMRDSVNPLKKHVARIPGPEIDVFLTETGDGQNIVDLTHQDVIDYGNMFSVGGECYISDGEIAADNGLISGKRVTHSSRRG